MGEGGCKLTDRLRSQSMCGFALILSGDENKLYSDPGFMAAARCGVGFPPMRDVEPLFRDHPGI